MEDFLFTYIDNWAEKEPDRIALLETDGTSKTYYQIKAFSEVVMDSLLKWKIGPEEKVLVLCKKSFYSIVAMIGIMRGGSCFIPYNLNKINSDFLPFLKKNKFTHIIIDIYALEILYKNKWFDENINYFFICDTPEKHLLKYDISSLNLKWIELCERKSEKGSNHSVNLSTDMLAYIIYTSGSTDNPKGVMISHDSITPVIKYRAESLEWNSDSIILSIAPQNFDMFIIELFCTFKVGGKILLLDRWRIIDELMLLVNKYFITNFITVPTLFSLIIKRKDKLSKYDLSSLKGIGFGGGKCPVSLLKELDNFFKNKVRFYHGYGLTETACHALYYTIEDVQKIQTALLPLGQAIPGTESYVLNEQGKEVNEGEIGELVIAGYNIMEGYYLNNAETCKRIKFIKDTLGNEVKALYTGDLVQKKDQQIFFVCRKDYQIKSAGHRVELDEIEIRIQTIENILECCVIAVPDPEYENKIWCFVVLKDNTMSIQDLRKEINNCLEIYMRPHKFFIVDKLPRNLNNKIDRQKLLKEYYENGEKNENKRT